MSRSTYAPKESYTGTGSLAVYTFDFKIEDLSQLLVIELNTANVETQRVRGTDVTYLSGVVFDAVDGGGTVTLAANLTNLYTLIFLLANDEPTQLHEFSNRTTFTLRRIESALDFLGGSIQRLAYRGKQAFRIHDSDDEETFNAQFPPGVTTANDKYLKVNTAGDGLEYGLTEADLSASGGGGGGMTITPTQDIGAAGTIALTSDIQQLLKVQGDAGPQTASIAPFDAPPTDGTIITLLGMDNAKILKIPYTDAAEGCMLRGDAYLGLLDSLTLIYDETDQRYWELSRNM